MSNPNPTFDHFLEQFAAEFEETDATSMDQDTGFRELEEWSSMQALHITLMCETNYGVQLATEDFKSSKTIGDLFAIVKKRVE